MISILINLVLFTEWILILLIFLSAILSYFMDPYHPLRSAVDRIVEPMLAPIRRIIPAAGMLDFSPLVLIILIQVLSNFLVRFLSSLR